MCWGWLSAATFLPKAKCRGSAGMFTSVFYFWPTFNKDATTIKQNTAQHDNIWHIIKNCHKCTGGSILLSLYLCETPLFNTKPLQLSEFLVVQKETFSRIMRSLVPSLPFHNILFIPRIPFLSAIADALYSCYSWGNWDFKHSLKSELLLLTKYRWPRMNYWHLGVHFSAVHGDVAMWMLWLLLPSQHVFVTRLALLYASTNCGTSC